jgi:hypothetical protein
MLIRYPAAEGRVHVDGNVSVAVSGRRLVFSVQVDSDCLA